MATNKNTTKKAKSFQELTQMSLEFNKQHTNKRNLMQNKNSGAKTPVESNPSTKNTGTKSTGRSGRNTKPNSSANQSFVRKQTPQNNAANNALKSFTDLNNMLFPSAPKTQTPAASKNKTWVNPLIKTPRATVQPPKKGQLSNFSFQPAPKAQKQSAQRNGTWINPLVAKPKISVQPPRKGELSSFSIGERQPLKFTPTQPQQKKLTFGEKAGTIGNVAQNAASSILTNQILGGITKNSIAWHDADNAQKGKLHETNTLFRDMLGLQYDAKTGTTIDPVLKTNLSAPVEAVVKANKEKNAAPGAEKLSHMERWEKMKQEEKDKKAVIQRGYEAHNNLIALYDKGDAAWSKEEKEQRKAYVSELEAEVKRIAEEHGLKYIKGVNTTGRTALETHTDDTDIIGKLKASGADGEIIQYVKENILLRDMSNRGAQAWKSIKGQIRYAPQALVETSSRHSLNVGESRKNTEYASLEKQAEQLEAVLASTPSTDALGNISADYTKTYAEYNNIKKRMQEIAVNIPVDPNAPGQKGLREAKEAQANATAGLSAAPRFLMNAGIGMAGNAPGIALSVVNPVLGSAYLGVNSAGGKAHELNEQGVAPGESLWRAVASGTVEALTEKLPLDNFASLIKTGGSGAIKNVLKQAGIEATEEAASYMANYALDIAAKDPNANFSVEDLLYTALQGGFSGFIFGAAGTAGGKVLNSVQAETEYKNYIPMPIEEQSLAVKAGRATTIQKPFTGEVPTQTVMQVTKSPLQIPEQSVISAQKTIDYARTQEGFRSTIRKNISSLFHSLGGQRTVAVEGLTHQGNPYDVMLNPNIAKKVASDPGMTTEKLSVFEHLDDAVRTSEYVGSGEYNKNKSKSGRVIRYDYFEKELKINNQPYIMTFDIEVYTDKNNFRTYRVIDEIDLTSAGGTTDHTSASPYRESSLFTNNSISQMNGNINNNSVTNELIDNSIFQSDGKLNKKPGTDYEALIREMNVPLGTAFTYGKTPLQAMREAAVKMQAEQKKAADSFVSLPQFDGTERGGSADFTTGDDLPKNHVDGNPPFIDKEDTLRHTEGEAVGRDTGTLPKGSLSNVDTRKWYLAQEQKIAGQVNKSQPVQEQARQAFELRNQYRTQARMLMSDRKLAESLDITDPNYTWEQIVQKQIDNGLSGDNIYRAILESSQKSRKSVNELLGLE